LVCSFVLLLLLRLLLLLGVSGRAAGGLKKPPIYLAKCTMAMFENNPARHSFFVTASDDGRGSSRAVSW